MHFRMVRRGDGQSAFIRWRARSISRWDSQYERKTEPARIGAIFLEFSTDSSSFHRPFSALSAVTPVARRLYYSPRIPADRPSLPLPALSGYLIGRGGRRPWLRSRDA
jgi:hypothetical protein